MQLLEQYTDWATRNPDRATAWLASVAELPRVLILAGSLILPAKVLAEAQAVADGDVPAADLLLWLARTDAIGAAMLVQGIFARRRARSEARSRVVQTLSAPIPTGGPQSSTLVVLERTPETAAALDCSEARKVYFALRKPPTWQDADDWQRWLGEAVEVVTDILGYELSEDIPDEIASGVYDTSADSEAAAAWWAALEARVAECNAGSTVTRFATLEDVVAALEAGELMASGVLVTEDATVVTVYPGEGRYTVDGVDYYVTGASGGSSSSSGETTSDSSRGLAALAAIAGLAWWLL